MKKTTIRIILLTAAIVLLWFFSAYYVFTHFEKSETGSIGDLFSPINSLFAGLAFSGIIVTIYLQQKELGLQRQELANTRDIFQKQKFENTFFQLSTLQQNLLNNIHHEYTLISTTNGIEKERNHLQFNGRAYFQYVETDFKDLFAFIKRTIKNGRLLDKENADANISRMLHDYSIDNNFFYPVGESEYHDIDLSDEQQLTNFLSKKIFGAIQPNVSHYYRHLFCILEFIDSSEAQDLSYEENETERTEIKKRFQQYAAFIQAQLSDAELFLLFYRTMHFPDMKKYLEKYKFCKSLPSSFLLSAEHVSWYSYG